MPESTNPSSSLPNDIPGPPAAGPPVTPVTEPTEPSQTSQTSQLAGPALAPPAVPVQTLTRPAPRTRTMVFGLILLVISGCVLIAQLTSINLDAGAVALTVMVIAGLLLVAGGRRNAN